MPRDAPGPAEQRSVNDWGEIISGALTRLRAEAWEALEEVRSDLGGKREKLSYADLVRLWRPKEGTRLDDMDPRAVEQRWRRGIFEAKQRRLVDVDVTTISEVIQALQKVRDRLPEGKAPRIRRLLYDEPEPAHRLFQTLYPGDVAEQNVSGLVGSWRLIHARANGKAFIVWHVLVEQAQEPTGGVRAWFHMETKIPANFVQNGRREELSKSASGAAHAVGATFYFIGVDCERRPITVSFVLPHGSLPKDRFNRAHGIIQRVSTLGIHAAPALLRRMNPSEKIVTGIFTTAQVTEQDLNSLSDDIATLCAISDEAGCTSLLLAEDSLGAG